MAENQDKSSNTYQKIDIHLPVKGLVTDFASLFQPDGTYTFALNATKVSTNGVMNSLSNEESNKLIAGYPTNTITGETHEEYTVSIELPTQLVVTNTTGVWNETLQIHDCGCQMVDRSYFIYFMYNEEYHTFMYSHIVYVKGGEILMSSTDEMFQQLFNNMDIINIYTNLDENSVFDLKYRYKVERTVTGNFKKEVIERNINFGPMDKLVNGISYNMGTDNGEFGFNTDDNSKSMSIMMTEQVRNNVLGIRVTNKITNEKQTLTARKFKDGKVEIVTNRNQVYE
jgi:hypothetical protein